MKTTLGFVIFAFVVLGLLLFLSSSKYPPLPKDKDHADLTRDSACSDCHGSGKRYQLKPEHPPKFECLKCHKPG